MDIAVVETPGAIYNCPWDSLATSAIPNALIMWPQSKSPIYIPFASVSRMERRTIA